MTSHESNPRSNYNRLSRRYDLLAGAGEARLRRLGLACLDLRPGEAVLEVGCGTGQALSCLAQSAAAGQGLLVGIDLSEGMLGVARARLVKMGFIGRVNLFHGDARYLPYSNGTFHAIFMAFTLELFNPPDIACVLGACWRVLARSGRICCVALAQPEQAAIMVSLYSWFHRRFPAVVDCRPIRARALIAQAGFQVQKAVRQSLWGLPVDIVVATKCKPDQPGG